MASSFRMTLFPPREATTTAEPPEPLTFPHLDSIMNNNSSGDCRPGGEAFWFIQCILWTPLIFVFIRVHSWFLSSRSFEMRRDLPRGGGIDGGRPRRIVVQADFRERNRPHGGTRRERLP